MPRNRRTAGHSAPPYRLVFPAVFAAAFLGVLGGCSSNNAADESSAPPAASTTTVVTSTPDASTTATTTTTPGTPPRNENTNAGPGGATGTETALADEINKKIIRNPQMTGSRVTAVVDASGVAVLTGFTQNRQQKALAEKSARDTVGVSSVNNKIEIRPTGGARRTVRTPPPAPKTTVIVVPGPGATPSGGSAVPSTEPGGVSAPDPGTEPAPVPPNEPTAPGGGGSGSPTAPPPAPPASTGGG